MQLSDELTLSWYKAVADIDTRKKIQLVRHTKTGKFYVKKVLSVYSKDVFVSLKEHPVKGIPRIYELVEEEKELILIEEYVSGDSLQEILDRRGCFSEEETVEITRKLCVIVSGLHHRNPPIIHRDIKPSNIILTPDQDLKLIDLDAAKEEVKEKKDTRLLGTMGYAAPEQYGFGASVVQTDIYEIGILMNVLLTGHIPNEEKAEGRLAELIDACTKLAPEDRIQDVDYLLENLNAFSEHCRVKGQGRHSEKRNWRRFLPPGFRTGTPSHMFAAVLGYAAILLLALNVGSAGKEPIERFLYGFFSLLAMLGVVFFTADYAGIQKGIPIVRSRNRLVSSAGVVLTDVFYVALLFFLLLMVETI